MITRLKRARFSLTAQVVFSLVALVILAAAAIGLPAIWLIRGELDRQAWALVEQGSSTAQALFAARQSDLNNLAILTAQRPTLIALLDGGPPDELAPYLETLRSGAGLDFILVCGPDQQPLAQTAPGLPAGICRQEAQITLDRSRSGAFPQAWMVASQDIPNSTSGFKIIAGLALDQAFAVQMRQHTGLEQTFLTGGELVASSFADEARAWQVLAGSLLPGVTSSGEAAQLGRSILDGRVYYSVRLPVDSSGFENVFSLPVSAIAETERRLTSTILWSILAVTALGSALGVFLASRINRPLRRLRDSAFRFRQGDLSTSVAVRTKVREVAEVGYALEDARISLQHTMGQLRQEKDWTDHLLEAIVEGILTLDRRSRITFFSQGAERITGWKREQVLGRSCDQVLVPAEGSARFSQLMPGPGQKRKIEVVLWNGRQAVLAITGAAFSPTGAGKARIALVLRDVSDEEAVRRLLGNFLANISHEFRTPLSALSASIELLLDQLPDLSQEELKELLNSLHLGTLSLQTLIDNLLEGASIETGRFRVHPQPVDVAEVVQETARIMKPLLEKYGQRLEIEMAERLPVVMADARRTGQVLVNLLSNAAKWGPPEAAIRVTVVEEDGEVLVRVADQGPGVPLQHQPEVFRRFVHVESGGGRAEYGAGLGLSVVKAIVEGQGGRVGVIDRPGGGAIFWFSLLTADSEAGARLSSSLKNLQLEAVAETAVDARANGADEAGEEAGDEGPGR